MESKFTIGSLFDGSGGFPLAAYLCGGEPLWAAEIEPYPIAVTRSRLHSMKHLGDIIKVNGAEIEPVDVITFGSPCQDLSVAGKRAGLKHEANGDEETTRSGLFMEAVRIIKEMREATNGEYPTFALWENVPGAFSSNKGEDFRIVCEELIKVVEPSAVMPTVPKNGWPYADSYVGDGWSLAYRVFDAQYWGVPQRRRRIHLVADFRGERAREVLFEREGVRGYFAEGRAPWKAASSYAERGFGADDRAGENAGGRGLDAVAYSFDSLASNSMKSSNPYSGCRQVEIAKTLDTTDPNPSKNQGGIAIVESVVYDGAGITSPINASNPQPGDPCHTLSTDSRNLVCVPYTLKIRCGCEGGGNGDGETVSTLTGDHENRITDYTSVVCLQGNGIDRADTAGCNGKGWKEDTCYTLNTIDRPAVAYLASGKDAAGTLMASMATKQCLGDQEAFSGDYHIIEERNAKVFRQGGFADYVEGEIGTLRAAGGDYGGGTENLLVERPTIRYIVRRLTPTECARLQGFADRWGDIEEKDTFTPEEFEFWHEVRNTHAAINGKKVQEYTETQMLTWYNKLHTDSAEYKMWGNGIALPPALYVMQGIADCLGGRA